MNATPLIILMLVACAPTKADQIKEADFPMLTVGTQVFTNAHLRAYSPSEGSVRHDGGLDKIKLQDLPEPIRSQFYDADRAGQAGIAKEQSAAARDAALQNFRASAIEQYRAAHFRIVEGKLINVTNKAWLSLDVKISAVRTNGVLAQLYHTTYRIIPGSNHAYAPGGNLMLGGGAPAYDHYRDRELTEQTVFIRCDPRIDALYIGQEKLIRAVKTTASAYDAGIPYQPQSSTEETSP